MGILSEAREKLRDVVLGVWPDISACYYLEEVDAVNWPTIGIPYAVLACDHMVYDPEHSAGVLTSYTVPVRVVRVSQDSANHAPLVLKLEELARRFLQQHQEYLQFERIDDLSFSRDLPENGLLGAGGHTPYHAGAVTATLLIGERHPAFLP